MLLFAAALGVGKITARVIAQLEHSCIAAGASKLGAAGVLGCAKQGQPPLHHNYHSLPPHLHPAVLSQANIQIWRMHICVYS